MKKLFLKNIMFFILLPTMLIYCGCEDSVDAYIGFYQQPDFEDDAYNAGLNIFGVIRTDSTANYNNSFIQIQKVLPAIGDTSNFDIEVDTASVCLIHIQNGLNDQIYEFLKTDQNDIFKQEHYRPSDSIAPKEGDIFEVNCISEGLPTLTARAIVPNKPKIVEGSLNYKNSALTFTLTHDTTYFMADVFAYSNGSSNAGIRMATNQDTHTSITVNSINAKPDSIVIYTYDYNFAQYYLTSNTSLNFNKYRASFSTIENGYGVFGAINQCTFLLE